MSRRKTARQHEQRPVSVHPNYCPTGKVGWLSRDDATHAMSYLQAHREGETRMERRPYECGVCPHYHLTSDSNRRQAG